MNIVTRQFLADRAALRWRWTYFEKHGYWRNTLSGGTEAIHDALVALGKSPSPEAVDAVVGNDSWTDLTCSSCSQRRLERVLAIDVTAGEYSTHICEKCVKEGASLFT